MTITSHGTATFPPGQLEVVVPNTFVTSNCIIDPSFRGTQLVIISAPKATRF